MNKYSKQPVEYETPSVQLSTEANDNNDNVKEDLVEVGEEDEREDEEIEEEVKDRQEETDPLTFTDGQGHDLLIDPDEDPEIAAQIDRELEEADKANPEAEKPTPPYLPSPPEGLEYTLVLDLDETLIHYRDDEEYYLVRPGVTQFLQELSSLYDIVLFTAGVKKYADWIVDHIDPQRYITHRLYRRHTVFKDAMYIKDLSMLGRDLRKTLIIDNLYESFLSQPDNGILVKSWYDDMDDTELLTLLPFLKGLVEDKVPDIREVLRRIMASNSDEGEGEPEGDADAEGDIDAEGEGNFLS
jgi:Dullard-like phosphatase family protein